ncbi:MAG: tetratricopeptide repeat protein [Bacteroidales bacterium]|nr:tetratricopeptide repeat protein [Bacteroidales bacterium]
MRKKTAILISILFFSNHFLSGQNTDSLINILQTENTEEKIEACLKLSNIYIYSKPDSAEYYLNYGLDLSVYENDLRHQAIFLQQKGILENERGNISSAKKNLRKTIQIAQEISDTSLIISGSGNLGNSHMYVGEYETAIELFTYVAIIAEKKQDIKTIATANGAIGNLYVYMKSYEKALPYYEKSKENFEKLNLEIGIALSLMNIAVVFYNTERYDFALDNYEKASEIFKETNNLLNYAKCISGVSRILSFKKQYKTAINEEKNALKVYKDLNAKIDIISSFSFIASNNLKLKLYKKAILYLDSGFNIASEENNYHHLSILSTTYKSCYDSLKDYKNAYHYSKLLKTYSDSIFNKESNERFSQLEIEYETAQKEQEIELLKKNEELLNKENRNRQILLIGLVILLLFSILLFFLLYNRYKLRTNKKTIEVEQKLLRIQMNPHFIFNALFAIESFMNKNDLKKSVLYMSNFSKLMRMILESSRKNLICLNKEIEILEYYIGFQMLRFNNKFTYKIEISDNIDKENTLIPPMLVQPFVENAIEHGFTKDIKSPELIISFISENNYISVSIQDNGKGINKTHTNKTNHQSLAIQITKERLSLIIGKKHKKNINLEVLNLNKLNTEQKGTKISFKIPHIEEF